jgi:hypothetical protein
LRGLGGGVVAGVGVVSTFVMTLFGRIWICGYEEGLWKPLVGVLVTIGTMAAMEVVVLGELVAVRRPVLDRLAFFEKPDALYRLTPVLLAAAVVGLVWGRMSVFSRSVPSSSRQRNCCRVP